MKKSVYVSNVAAEKPLLAPPVVLEDKDDKAKSSFEGQADEGRAEEKPLLMPPIVAPERKSL